MKTLLRMLVVDDSRLNRERLSEIVHASGFAEVVGEAHDGAQALKLVNELTPDAIFLDLEMPRMDGFSFLRLLMSSSPTPVIVVSSFSRKENVFRALELGAVDFVAKNDFHLFDARLRALLHAKLRLLRSVKRSKGPVIRSRTSSQKVAPADPVASRALRHVVAIGASTGGPTAVTEVLSRLSSEADYAVLVAQHMPASFTFSFSRRLNRLSALAVKEAKDGDLVVPGSVLVCPGDFCMELTKGPLPDNALRVRVFRPSYGERYVPNASRLLRSVAEGLRERAVGVVLTGMGDDGAEGAKAIAARGGCILVESEESAVVFGMPRATARMVPEAQVLTLSEIAAKLGCLAG